MRVLKSLAALAALAALLVGLPIALWLAGGNPLATDLPSLDQVRTALSTPDDGTLALAAMRIAGWVVWVLLVVCTAVELANLGREGRGLKIPGLSLPQNLVRALLATAALGAVAGPQAASAVESPAHQTANTEQEVAQVDDLGDREGDGEAAAADTTVIFGGASAMGQDSPVESSSAQSFLHVVRPGETLWELAEQYLGDGERWTELQDANPQVSDPAVLLVGSQLRIPAAAGTASLPAASPQAEQAPVPPAPAAAASDDTVLMPRPDMDQADAGSSPFRVPKDTMDAPEPVEEPQEDVPEQAPVQQPEQVSPVEQPPAVADAQEQESALWMLAGLGGGGAVLAGGLWLLLRRRRRDQFMSRRPGRTIAAPPVELAPVEKSITTAGQASEAHVLLMDAALRNIAVQADQQGRALPTVAAVELGQTLRVYCTEAEDLAAPWRATDSPACWELPLDAEVPSAGGAPAPWPLLVTVGQADDGALWLLNLERLGKVQVEGPRAQREDLMRYVCAELAINAWSAGVTVDCVGLGDSLVGLNPDRVVAHEQYDPEQFCAHVLQQRSAASEMASGVPGARVEQAGDEMWTTRVLVAAEHSMSGQDLDAVCEVLSTHECQGAALVTGSALSSEAVQVQVTQDGRVQIPTVGLDLQAVSLTAEEAAGCGALLAAGEQTQDQPIPNLQGDEPWTEFVDAAGGLRAEHQLPRQFELDGVSVLPADDDAYLAAAPTCAEDLQVLAPRVAPQTAEAITASDPDLDADWEAWNDPASARPKVRLLGPVVATTKGDARVVARRKAFYTELLAFLTTRPHGATRSDVAEAFGLSDGRVRTDIKVVRDWLGTNPATGQAFLPSALESPQGKARGVGVYQVVDGLTDIDLFRRLRARGTAAGPEGMQDLERALELVTGTPFTDLRPGGWSWLLEGDRLDQHMLVAVVDVAHTVTVHHLQEGDIAKARAVAEKASATAPDEAIPRWDLAAVADAEGRQSERAKIVHEVCNGTDDLEAPRDLSEWSQDIISAKGWAHAS